MVAPDHRTNEGRVVAFVPVVGRADSHTLLAHTIRRLRDVADRIVVLAGHSEKDIAAAASADGGVRVVPDLAAAVAALDADTRVVLVHDPRWELAPAELITRVVDTVLADGVPAVPVLPCTDTVKRLDERGFVIDTPDRAGLAVLRSPLGWPVAAIRSDALAPGEFPVGARAVTL